MLLMVIHKYVPLSLSPVMHVGQMKWILQPYPLLMRVIILSLLKVTHHQKPKVEDNFFDDFFSDIIVTEVEPAATALDRVKKELKLYLTLPVNGADFKLLDWWKKHEYHLPLLARLAKNILCTPATFTPSERVFSKVGTLVSRKRAGLKPSKVDMALFLNANYNL